MVETKVSEFSYITKKKSYRKFKCLFSVYHGKIHMAGKKTDGEKYTSQRTPFPGDTLPRSHHPNCRKIRPATKPDGLVIAKKPHPRFLTGSDSVSCKEIGHDSNELAFSMVLPNRSICRSEQIEEGESQLSKDKIQLSWEKAQLASANINYG